MFSTEAEVSHAKTQIESGQVSKETCDHIIDEIIGALKSTPVADSAAAEELAGELVAEAAEKYGFAETTDADDAIWLRANEAVDQYLEDEFGE